MKLFNGLLFLLCCQLSHAEIYQWVDENGKRHFSDRKPANAAGVKTLKPTLNSYQNTRYSKAPNSQSIKPQNTKPVVMYSASWCGYCRKARNYFKKNKIDFVEYDVETSPKGKADYKRLKATGVPVILIGKQRMNGFNQSSFKRLYES